jgi:hypothetical protein
MKRDYTVFVKIGFVFLVILLVYGLYYWFLYSGFPVADESATLNGVRSGTFGDAFGALNALFSGMAFAGVVVTLYLQRKDIEDGQHEIARQQSEAARQKEESQFYNMLSLQQSVVQGFDLHKTATDGTASDFGSDIIRGRDCFKTWTAQLKSSHKRKISMNGATDLQWTYEQVWKKHRGDWSIYFRSLYNLFKFVSTSSHADKRWLGNVVRSLISDYELVILFYNCLSPKGEKFKAFANEFAIFDNLDPMLLLDPKHALQLDKEAYGKNEEILVLFPD